jgi:hypothetical protein
VGVAATVGVQHLIGLSTSFFQSGVVVEGQVLNKEASETSLRLRLSTDQGVMLATFTKKLSEMESLIEEGDWVSLSIKRYSPFVDDPELQRVRKPESRKAAMEPRPPASAKESPEETQRQVPDLTGGAEDPLSQAETKEITPSNRPETDY